MSENILLFEKTYYGESLVDIEQDVWDACADDRVPIDKHGFAQGAFKVTITWVPENE